MAFSAKRTPVDDLRQSLKSLRINRARASLTTNKARARDYRVSKPRQLDRATAAAEAYAMRPLVNWTRHKLGQLKPEQQDRAIAILNALQHMERFAERAPQLRPQQSDDPAHGQVVLEYPWHRFSKCLRGRSLPDLKKLDLPELRRCVVQDLDLLYAQHFPYTPDLTRLAVVENISIRPAFRPFIGALDFDFDIDINDPTVPWAELMRTRRQMVEAQFDVVEVIPY